jgi:hypothetical protein
MSSTDFAAALEAELHRLGVPFDRAELLAFAACVWPLAADEPDPGRWAREFLEAAAPCACRRREAARIVSGVAEAFGRAG